MVGSNPTLTRFGFRIVAELHPEGCAWNDGTQVIKPEPMTSLGLCQAKPARLQCARDEGDDPEAGAVAARGARETQPGAGSAELFAGLSLPSWLRS